MSFLFYVFLGLSVVSSQGQGSSPAKVPVPELAAKVGYTANFTCESYGVPISVCLWERQGDNKQLISFNQGSTAGTGGYGYVGAGLDKGSCGLVISVVKEIDNAVWDCKLITNSGIYQGNVRVGILSKFSFLLVLIP